MATSAKMVASELRVPVVGTNFGYRSYQFLRAAGAPVGGAAGGGLHSTQKLIFFSARTDHYENIFEAFSLPARTFTKIFSKRFFCPRGPLRNIFEAFFRPDYGEATIGCTD